MILSPPFKASANSLFAAEDHEQQQTNSRKRDPEGALRLRGNGNGMASGGSGNAGAAALKTAVDGTSNGLATASDLVEALATGASSEVISSPQDRDFVEEVLHARGRGGARRVG